MAAFLTEMKTKKLRKVSSGESVRGNYRAMDERPKTGFHNIGHSNSGIARRVDSLYSNSLASVSMSALNRSGSTTSTIDLNEFRTGEKRKRFDSMSSDSRSVTST